MDWWLIPVGLGVAVLLRLLWVAAFHSDDTVTAMPELDGYVPGEHSGGGSPGEPTHGATSSDPLSGEEPPTKSGESVHSEPELTAEGPGSDGTTAGRQGFFPNSDAADEDGIWIELDVEPLFPSSERNHIVDLIEESESETSR